MTMKTITLHFKLIGYDCELDMRVEEEASSYDLGEAFFKSIKEADFQYTSTPEN